MQVGLGGRPRHRAAPISGVDELLRREVEHAARTGNDRAIRGDQPESAAAARAFRPAVPRSPLSIQRG